MKDGVVAEEIGANSALPEGCPVRPLGHCGGVYFFLTAEGEVRVMKPAEFTVNGVLSLFGADDAWLLMHYGSVDKRGEKSNSGNFELTWLTKALMRACVECGLWDPETPSRGLGVWREGGFEDARTGLVVHSGDRLFRTATGGFSPAGVMMNGIIYPAKHRIPAVADKAATAEDGAFLLETVSMWKFRRQKLDPLLVTGFIGQAALGGAPRWRGHMYATGKKGSGKSWLAELVQGTLGAGAFDIKNNFTEAYLRQSMAAQARCLVLDEAENEPGGGRVAKVIELIRHMSSKEGAKTGRGGAGGTPMSGTVTGCAYLSSVLHVPLQPTDKSRITCIQLEPHGQAAPEAITELENRILKLRQLSPAYRRRMVDKWQVFLDSFSKYRAAFMKLGLDSRGADQPATLFAGAAVLLGDDVPHDDVVDAHAELGLPLLSGLRDDEEDGEGQQCLNHLYSSFTDVSRGGAKMTLGQLVLEALQGHDLKSIGAYGMTLDGTKDDPVLVVANRAAGLQRIFAGTRWENGGWVQALEYVGGFAPPRANYRFAGALSRGQGLPKEVWPNGGVFAEASGAGPQVEEVTV